MRENNLFAITKNSDSTEGRGHEITIAYTNDKKLAVEIVNDPRFSRYCVMGGHTPGAKQNEYQISQKNIIIVDTVNQFFEIDDKVDREEALAKLSQREKILLGLV